jgi:hypothetical protein
MSRYLAIGLLTFGVALLPLPAAADASSEIVIAAQHAGYAAQSSTIDMVHTHLHHTLNCLVGPAGMDFDKDALNPCKNAGNGAIPDTTDAAKQKALEDAADKARAGLKTDDLAAAQKDASETEAMLKAIK